MHYRKLINRDDLVSINGAMGEGGGQILRTSLALSLCLGKPFRIVNLRAGRKKPGLRRQHLVCVKAAAKIGGAKVEGASLGSQELTFIPTSIRPGDYNFDIGSAGSTTLVLQSILPALLMANGPSTLTLQGGTHNPFAPPFEFLEKAFLPIINRMGPKIQACLERPGYYPKGGGRLSVTIQPAKKLQILHLDERGEIQERRATATVAGLPRHIAERELRVIGEKLQWGKECLHIREESPDRGPGNIVTIEIKSKNITEVFTAFGERGVRAETVADKAAKAAYLYMDVNVPVGKHLADQLLLPFTLAGGGSFNTLQPTLHTRTNSEVVQLFQNIRISMDQVSKKVWQITVSR
jgi:RNA 3'-terminal phosphate cyclase (ATP)